ncbi:MAG: ABC transporter substrate-binding protein [Firmicutes bacterium]|nr:ABC transporter substrate-binding protein [Bacillota bacterium]
MLRKFYLKNKHWIASTFVLLLVIILMAGCGSRETSSEPGNSKQENNELETHIVTDHAGREVEIPAKVEKVFATGPIGSIFLYTLAPEKMIGWNNEFSDSAREFIPEEYANLPVLGRWAGADVTGNVEEILKLAPDIMINVGSITQEWVDLTDQIQEQTGIPVLNIDGSFFEIANSYGFLADILGVEERGSLLAAYATDVIKSIEDLRERVETGTQRTVYYGSGEQGLSTSSRESINAEMLEIIGAKNVAESGGGNMEVTIEQIITWNPDVILISDTSGAERKVYQMITAEDSPWENIAAVNNNRVYTIPNLPFDWINRPPSVMRLIGAKWLAHTLYPDLYPIDIRDEVKEFMKLFFNYELKVDDFEKIFHE